MCPKIILLNGTAICKITVSEILIINVCKDTRKLIYQQNVNIRDKSKMGFMREKGNLFGKMALFMKEILRIIELPDLENLLGLMGASIREKFLMVREMDMEFSIRLLNSISILGNGSLVESKEKGKFYIQINQYMRESFIKIKSRDMGK